MDSFLLDWVRGVFIRKWFFGCWVVLDELVEEILLVMESFLTTGYVIGCDELVELLLYICILQYFEKMLVYL